MNDDSQSVVKTDQRKSGESAGEVGIPVDAVCTGCLSETGQRRVRIKRASMDELGVDDLEAAEGRTFRHVCHRWRRTLGREALQPGLEHRPPGRDDPYRDALGVRDDA